MAVKQLPKISDLPEPPDRLVGDQERFDVLTFNSLKAQKKMVNDDLNKTLIPALNEFALDVNASIDAAKASETSALASKDSAASSATMATTKAGEAAASATAAKASETSALNSKNAAGISATTAANAQKAAEAARDEAQDLANVGYASTTHSGLSRVDGETIQAGEFGKLSIVQSVMELLQGAVQKTRKVIAGTGLTGGGDLSGDVTLSVKLTNSVDSEDDETALTPAAVKAALSALLPKKSVIMWSGSADAIPTGWTLCDGTNGTPNLQGRFVVGAGPEAYTPGATGGKDSITPAVAVNASGTGVWTASAGTGIWTGSAGTGISIYGTTLDTNTLPYHNHMVLEYAGTSGEHQAHLTGSTNGASGNYTSPTGASWAHAHGVADPGHAHAIGDPGHAHAIGDNGHAHTAAASALDNRPPYYALCFIMKL